MYTISYCMVVNVINQACNPTVHWGTALCLQYCRHNIYYQDIICQDVRIPLHSYPISLGMFSNQDSINPRCDSIYLSGSYSCKIPKNMDSWPSDSAAAPHWWSALKQHAGSQPAWWLLFTNVSSNLHVERISLWAMKLHRSIYFSKKSINTIQISVCLVMTFSHGHAKES